MGQVARWKVWGLEGGSRKSLPREFPGTRQKRGRGGGSWGGRGGGGGGRPGGFFPKDADTNTDVSLNPKNPGGSI